MDKLREKDVRQAFGKVLRLRRNALGLSQEELAHRSNVSMRFISLLETDNRQPTLTKLFALSKGLDINLSDFIREIEDELV